MNVQSFAVGAAIGAVSFVVLVAYAVCVAWMYGGWLVGVPVSCIAGFITGAIVESGWQ